MKRRIVLISVLVVVILGACGEENTAPIIDEFIVPETVAPGSQVDFQVVAHDADGDILTYTWTVDDHLLSDTTPNATWKVPKFDAPMVTVTIQVSVSDGESHVKRQKELTVVDNRNWVGNWKVQSDNRFSSLRVTDALIFWLPLGSNTSGLHIEIVDLTDHSFEINADGTFTERFEIKLQSLTLGLSMSAIAKIAGSCIVSANSNEYKLVYEDNISVLLAGATFSAPTKRDLERFVTEALMNAGLRERIGKTEEGRWDRTWNGNGSILELTGAGHTTILSSEFVL